MHCPPLYYHVPFAENFLLAIIECQLDFAFKHNTKIYTLRSMLDVQSVFFWIRHREKVADTTVNARIINQWNQLSVVVNKGGGLCLVGCLQSCKCS